MKNLQYTKLTQLKTAKRVAISVVPNLACRDNGMRCIVFQQWYGAQKTLCLGSTLALAYSILEVVYNSSDPTGTLVSGETKTNGFASPVAAHRGRMKHHQTQNRKPAAG